MEVIKAQSKEHFQYIRELFREYANSLDFSLGFQNFDKELKELPGEYAPPNGCILIARFNKKIVGCVALRRISKDICEMKRLYVRPKYRVKGIGKKLAEAIINEAQNIGYKKMRLDTISFMKKAIALYESLGFKEIEPYRYNPIEGARYYELDINYR
ncbi:GNAT family N-acetyltransferase [Thermohalobacter berrensis]|uniref:GNAT family N-acetyltransferase n=1 Tax=Thermohalobacter berrensis TaxID=99594 RepID=UPI001FAA79B2|nr:GNAT family N-acetyltransferase [Thermohalobacter berrensis]